MVEVSSPELAERFPSFVELECRHTVVVEPGIFDNGMTNEFGWRRENGTDEILGRRAKGDIVHVIFDGSGHGRQFTD